MGHLFPHSNRRKAYPILPHLINKGKWSGEEPHIAPSGGTYGKSGMQEMQKGELGRGDAVMLDTGANVLACPELAEG